MRYFKSIILILVFTVFFSCELETELRDAQSTGSTETVQLLNGAYSGLRDYQPQDNLLSVTTHTSDEMAGPTRGTDWDDAGAWRQMHLHTWTPTHPHINAVWTIAGRNSFNAQQVICDSNDPSEVAQATFLRAFNDFIVMDNYGVIQRRECGSDFLNPPDVISRDEAVVQLIEELEGVLDDLPQSTDASVASQNAGRSLLMKLYLNKAVFTATEGGDGEAIRALPGPYSFNQADMTAVIQLADDISGVSLTENYYDNFIPANGETSTELLFVSKNTDGGPSGAVRTRWHMTLHYNQVPAGWNGFVALTDLYNLYEEEDERRYSEMPQFENNGSGLNAGFLVGQQYDVDGNAIQDRNGNPLIFTPEFDLIQTGDAIENSGIRAMKYVIDFPSDDDFSDNDFVFLRYADVLLMKAEALLRGGSGSGDATAIINEIRELRGASVLGSVTLQDILDERARELYWEGWRRNDQIRFNTFLSTWQEKSSPSGNERLLFPIPAEALSTNPNLIQHDGY